jgi:hypothetical protein
LLEGLAFFHFRFEIKDAEAGISGPTVRQGHYRRSSQKSGTYSLKGAAMTGSSI